MDLIKHKDTENLTENFYEVSNIFKIKLLKARELINTVIAQGF